MPVCLIAGAGKERKPVNPRHLFKTREPGSGWLKERSGGFVTGVGGLSLDASSLGEGISKAEGGWGLG